MEFKPHERAAIVASEAIAAPPPPPPSSVVPDKGNSSTTNLREAVKGYVLGLKAPNNDGL